MSDLLSEEFEGDWRYSDVKNPVATKWLVSFEHIRRVDPLAAEYFSFMACIEPRYVPQSLLPPAQSLKEETDAIGSLIAYSFVSRRPAEQSLDLPSTRPSCHAELAEKRRVTVKVDY